jgi:hypothetical protein
LLASGYARQPSLFGLLRELPVFGALRYPERFLWLAILFASEAAAFALANIPALGDGKRWRVGVWLILGGSLAWTIAGQISAFGRVASSRTLGVLTESTEEDFHQSRGNRWLAVHVQSRGVGSLGCYETHRLAQSRLLRGDLPAEEYLAPGSADAGSVRRVSWSPNRIGLHVDVSRPVRVLVNQNWAPGWHASTGTVVSNEGLLAVDVPAGSHEVAVAFRPRSTLGGAAVTATSLLSLAFLVWRTRRRGEILSARQARGTILAVLLPWAVAGVAYASSPDPKWPPPPLNNANGAPAVIEPEGEKHLSATEVGATFDLPLTVVAGHVSGPDEHSNLTVEVYLRRTGRIPRSTAMFMHLERRDGQPLPPLELLEMLNADHQVVGGTFYLSDTPNGRLVRDVTGKHLDKAAPGVWDVWVAFGHVSGTRGRAKVTSAGAAEVSADRVRVGTFIVP